MKICVCSTMVAENNICESGCICTAIANALYLFIFIFLFLFSEFISLFFFWKKKLILQEKLLCVSGMLWLCELEIHSKTVQCFLFSLFFFSLFCVCSTFTRLFASFCCIVSNYNAFCVLFTMRGRRKFQKLIGFLFRCENDLKRIAYRLKYARIFVVVEEIS